MRISDWSSDVCSSDLTESSQAFGGRVEKLGDLQPARRHPLLGGVTDQALQRQPVGGDAVRPPVLAHELFRLRDLRGKPGQGDLQGLHRVAIGHRERLGRSEEHTSELQPLMRISYAVSCLKKKT